MKLPVLILFTLICFVVGQDFGFGGGFGRRADRRDEQTTRDQGKHF